MLLVLGGSQGARYLNELVVRMWPRLKRAIPGLEITLVSGREDETRAAEAFAAARVCGKVVGFMESMEELYARADLVLARSGATSLAEIAAFGLPSILIPYPHAADDHQTANANVFMLAGACWTIPQEKIDLDRFVQRVTDAILQPERRRRMAQAAKSRAKPVAAAEVVDRLERLAGLCTCQTPPPVSPVRPDAVHMGLGRG